MKLSVSAFSIILAVAQLYVLAPPSNEPNVTEPAGAAATAAVTSPAAAQTAKTTPAPVVKPLPQSKPYTSFKEVENQVKQALSGREPTWIVTYDGDTSHLKEDIDAAFADIFAQDNYIHYTTKSYQANYAYHDGRAQITYSFTYWETKAETDYVQTHTPVLLTQIVRPNMTDAQKARAIHDWIAGHVAFDDKLGSDSHSAYAALAGRKAVCQGYALLGYKLLTLAGLESRIVEGIAGDEDHIWNMVKLGGRWYHIDMTWDRAIAGVRGVRYDYFNVSDAAIGRDHRWTLSYPTAEHNLYAAK